MITKSRCAASLVIAALVLAFASPAGAASDPTKDQTIAHGAVITIGDLPAGWKSAGAQPAESFKVSSCSQIKSVTNANKKYVAKSDQFESTTGFAENSVYVFPTAAAAKAYLKPIVSTGKKCLLDGATKGLKGAKITVDTIDPSAMVQATKADGGVIFRTTIVQTSGTTVLIQAGVRVGRAFDGFTFGDTTNQTLPEGQDLVIASVERLIAGLG